MIPYYHIIRIIRKYILLKLFNINYIKKIKFLLDGYMIKSIINYNNGNLLKESIRRITYLMPKKVGYR